jgi:hypothetical protein
LITTIYSMKLLLENWRAYLKEDCWDGYERVEGTAEGEPGSCRKKTNESEDLSEENKTPAEGGICAAGEAAAKRKGYDWPSAYASMYASRWCKDDDFDRGKKKDESLKIQREGDLKKWRDENWVQSDGSPCGDDKAQKNPKRCKPAKKWASMSDSEKKADNAKKKEGGRKGKKFVKATKKGEVKGYSESLEEPLNEEYYEVAALDESEEYCPVCVETMDEAKKKKPCKPSKGKRFAKRVDGKCRSYGQSGQAKGGGDRIRPGTKKGDAYCARSAGIKKCKNPPCANTLSRKKWKCRGKKSMKQE